MDATLDFLIKYEKELNSLYRDIKKEDFPFSYISKHIVSWRLNKDIEYPLNILDFILRHFGEMKNFLGTIIPDRVVTYLSKLSGMYLELLADEDTYPEYERYQKEDFSQAESAFLKSKKMRPEDKKKVKPNSMYHKLFYEIASDPKYLAKHLIENLSLPIEKVMHPSVKNEFLKDLKGRDVDLYYKYINRFEKDKVGDKERFELAIKNIESEIGEELVNRIRKGLKTYPGDSDKERPLANLRRVYKMVINKLAKDNAKPIELVRAILRRLLENPIVASFKLAPFFSTDIIGEYKDLFVSEFENVFNQIRMIDGFRYNDNGKFDIPMNSISRLIGIGMLNTETAKKILLNLIKKDATGEVIKRAKKSGLEDLLYEIEGLVGENINEFNILKRPIEDPKSFENLIEKINSIQNEQIARKYISYYIISLFNNFKESMFDLLRKIVDGYKKIKNDSAKKFYFHFIDLYFKKHVYSNLENYVKDIIYRVGELNEEEISFLKKLINFNEIKVNSPEMAAFVYVIYNKDKSINKESLVNFFERIFRENDPNNIRAKIESFFRIVSEAGVHLNDIHHIEVLLDGINNKMYPKPTKAEDFINILNLREAK